MTAMFSDKLFESAFRTVQSQHRSFFRIPYDPFRYSGQSNKDQVKPGGVQPLVGREKRPEFGRIRRIQVIECHGQRLEFHRLEFQMEFPRPEIH